MGEGGWRAGEGGRAGTVEVDVEGQASAHLQSEAAALLGGEEVRGACVYIGTGTKIFTIVWHCVRRRR